MDERKFCNYCGAELSPDDKFCANCGHEVIDKSELSFGAKKRFPKFFVILFIIFLSGFFAAVIFLISLSGRGKNVKFPELPLYAGKNIRFPSDVTYYVPVTIRNNQSIPTLKPF